MTDPEENGHRHSWTPVLPPMYYARCTESACTWEATCTPLKGNPDPKEYRDELAVKHAAGYGHTVTKTDYP